MMTHQPEPLDPRFVLNLVTKPAESGRFDRH